MTTKLSPSPPTATYALPEEVLAAMDQKERDFWEQLFQLVTKEIAKNKAAGRCPLFTPSPELRKRLQSAVEEHKGLQYCQMRRLYGIFCIY